MHANGMKRSGSGTGRLSSLVKNLKTGLFGALFIMSKKISSRPWQVGANTIIMFLQMLAFVFTTPPMTNNFKDTIAPVRFVVGLFNPQRWLPFLTSTFYVVLWFMAVAWVVTFLALMVWSMYSFVHNNFAVVFPLRILRVMGQLSAGILFMPLVTLLMGTFQCGSPADGTWSVGGYTCGSPTFLAMQGVAVVLSIALYFLCSMFALVFYDSNPLSPMLEAKAHGRAEFVFLSLQVVLVLTLNVFEYLINQWIMIAVMIGAGVVWAGSILFFMPYYRHTMNTVRATVGRRAVRQ